MLEHLPRWIGALLKNIRAGHTKLTIVQENIAPANLVLELSSPAFANGARLPARFTADGAGLSPPLVWRGVPEGTASLALLVEDADTPLPNPIVHALVWNLPAQESRLAEGVIGPGADGSLEAGDVGRNSYFLDGWLPPDPPPGHGSHDYVFQLFALSDTPDIGDKPGRSRFAEAITGRVLAAGLLVGTYSRGEPGDESAAASDFQPAPA
jgi:Raf kinase inhibitor-like YbhB/YbcL family protein